MSRRLSIILALAAVVVAIGAYIIVRNLPQKTVEPETFQRWTHLNVRTSDLVYIDFQRGANDELTFEKVQKEVDGKTVEEWEVTHPKLSFVPKTSAVTDFAFGVCLSCLRFDRSLDFL